MKELTFYGILSVMNIIFLFATENIVIAVMNCIAFIITFAMFIYYYFSHE